MQDAVVLTQLSKRYGATRALDGLNLRVGQGELFGLVGVNGAGKTSTLSVVMGFIQPGGGEARVLGHDPWRDTARLMRRVAWLPGEVHLPDQLTGRSWLAYQARLARLDSGRIEALAREWSVPLDRPMRTLSKGNRQKVALLRLLASDAALLVLDEPTSGLDPVAQERLLLALRARAQAGVSVLFSSHSLSEVQTLCDRVAVIDRGRVQREGSVAQVAGAGERRLEAWTRRPIDPGSLAAWQPRLHGERRVVLHGERLLEDALPRLLEFGVERLEFGGEGLEGLLSRVHAPAREEVRT